MKKNFYILVLFIAIVGSFVVYKYFSTTQKFNVSISGWFIGNQVWSGDIYVTGNMSRIDISLIRS